MKVNGIPHDAPCPKDGGEHDFFDITFMVDPPGMVREECAKCGGYWAEIGAVDKKPYKPTIHDLMTRCGWTVKVHDFLDRAQTLFDCLGYSSESRRVYLGPKAIQFWIQEKPFYPEDENPKPGCTCFGNSFGFVVYGQSEEGMEFEVG